jgi:hypothetical protein
MNKKSMTYDEYLKCGRRNSVSERNSNERI